MDCAVSTVVPVNKVDALFWLFTLTAGILFDPTVAGPQLETLKCLVEQADCYRLFLGRDAVETPATVAQVLETYVGLVPELTDRCNLNCQHCFTGRHSGRDELSIELIVRVLQEARACGFDAVSLTGGEPTIHRHFFAIVEQACAHGYTFAINSNGWNFVTRYPKLLPFREQLQIITFSLDGASEATHDQQRGKGSFRRVLQATSVCFVEQIPFSINMVVTAHNRHELAAVAQLATTVRARGLRYGHLIPVPITTELGWDLSPWEHKRAEAEIWQLRYQRHPHHIAAGSYTTDLFPCSPLNGQNINIDCRGNLTKCCVLSGHGVGAGTKDIIGNLHEMSFAEAWQQFSAENDRFHAAKERAFAKRAIPRRRFLSLLVLFRSLSQAGLAANTCTDHPWRDRLWSSPVPIHLEEES